MKSNETFSYDLFLNLDEIKTLWLKTFKVRNIFSLLDFQLESYDFARLLMAEHCRKTNFINLNIVFVRF